MKRITKNVSLFVHNVLMLGRQECGGVDEDWSRLSFLGCNLGANEIENLDLLDGMGINISDF